MSYVAEPFIHITEQLLTALTGGVAREAHRFFKAANKFSFTMRADQVLIDSIKVTGQRQGSFFVFLKDRDFQITTAGFLVFKADDSDAGLPAAGASWPDEASEFFVSYYHDESYKAPLTDRNVGSLNRTLAESFGREVTVLRKQMEFIYNSGFVDTAVGSALDRVVELLGLRRKNRQYAAGSVQFYRDSPAPADIFIPQGTKVSTAVNPPASFTTSQDRTLRRGQLALDVDVRSEIAGAAGVVAAEAITVINQPILGINGVTNNAPTLYGGKDESDDELRQRAKKVMERVGKATPKAIIHALTEIGSLKENDIKLVEELNLRPGVVKVYIASKPNTSLAAEVEEAILKTRPAGIRVEHNLQSFVAEDNGPAVAADEVRDDGITIPDAAEAADSFELPLRADLTIFPENNRLTSAEKNNLRQGIEKTISDYIDNLTIGDVIIYNRLVSEVMAQSGIRDMTMTILAKSDTTGMGKRNLDLPAGRKAVLAAADLTVVFAGAPVYFDIDLKVNAKAGSGKDAIIVRARDLLSQFLMASPAAVKHDDLLSALDGDDHFSVVDKGLNWAVEYDQAGLVIHETVSTDAAVDIPGGDRPELRDLTVTVET